MRWSISLSLSLASAVLVVADSLPPLLTIDDVLEAPRPSVPVVSPDGTLAAQVVDRWDGKKDEMTRTLYLLSLNSSNDPVTLLTGETGHIGDLVWLSDDRLAYLNDTAFYHFSPTSQPVSPAHAFNFPNGTNPSSLKYQADSGVLAFSGVVWKHDEDFETVPEIDAKYEKRGDTGVVYEDQFLRYWDHWLNPQQVFTIGTVHLDLGEGVSALSKGGKTFHNTLKGTGLHAIFDPMGDFVLTPTHLIVSSHPPGLPENIEGRDSLFKIPLDPSAKGGLEELTPGYHGSIGNVAISPKGDTIAWVQNPDPDVSWRHGHLMVRHLAKNDTKDLTADWDQDPRSLEFSEDGASLYFLSEHHGRVLPYHLIPDQKPTALLSDGATAGLSVLPGSRVLLTTNSVISPNEVSIFDHSKGLTGKALSAVTKWSEYLAPKLAPFKPEEIWFKGGDGYDVQAWVIKPRGWSAAAELAGQTWPLEFAVHGGPEASAEDAWITRWNYALHASQGYFVVQPNAGGSTGFGEAFQHRLTGKWGGPLLDDCLAAYHTALDKYPIDKDRTVMTGASYGGYAANWIQGHNDQFGFKAIVCHDGIFDLELMLFTDDAAPLSPHNKDEADPMTEPEKYRKWSPKSFISEWKTPMMIIHSGMDYRCPIHEGIAAYKTLQGKNIPARFLYFPDENHWVLKPHNARRWFTEIFKWMDEWVGEDAKGVKLEAQEQEKPLFTIQV